MDKSPSSTNTKRSIHRRILQYQQRVVEQPTSFLPTTLMSTYLTDESIQKISPVISSTNSENMQSKQVERKVNLLLIDLLLCVFKILREKLFFFFLSILI
jgi:hypothetical protein